MDSHRFSANCTGVLVTISQMEAVMQAGHWVHTFRASILHALGIQHGLAPTSTRISMTSLFISRLAAAITTFMVLFQFDLVFAMDPPISIEEVARILEYPAEKLKVEDVTEQANRRAERKGNLRGISVHDFSGYDNTFARLSIAVAGEGTLLTDDIKRHVTKAIASVKEVAGTNLFFKWLTFDDVGYGVAGLGMVGAGGSSERCIMTLFGKMDVQVTISIPGETRLEVLPEAEAYHELIYEGGVADKLIECLNTIASKAAGTPIKAVISETPPPEAIPPGALMPSPKRSQRPSLQLAPAPQPAATPPAHNQPLSTSRVPWWALAVLVVLGFFIWRVVGRRS
jgi:hypothetical protein